MKVEKWTHRYSGRLMVGKSKHIYWEVDGKLFRRKKDAIEYKNRKERE